MTVYAVLQCIKDAPKRFIVCSCGTIRLWSTREEAMQAAGEHQSYLPDLKLFYQIVEFTAGKPEQVFTCELALGSEAGMA